MATYPPPPPGSGPQPFVPPAAKKNNLLKWVLIGVGGVFLLMFLAMCAVGYFVWRVKQNPGLAFAKVALAANPNVEVVSSDTGKQEITVRDKRTGKLVTMSWEDAKNGKLSFKEDGKEALTINSNGGNGVVQMKSADGSFQLGGDIKIPTWVPAYPGTDPKAAFSAQGKDGSSGSFGYKTKDSTDKVIKFYQDEFQSAGFKLNTNMTTQNAGSSGGMMVAQDAAEKHTITVIIGQDSGETSVSVTYSSK